MIFQLNDVFSRFFFSAPKSESLPQPFTTPFFPVANAVTDSRSGSCFSRVLEAVSADAGDNHPHAKGYSCAWDAFVGDFKACSRHPAPYALPEAL